MAEKVKIDFHGRDKTRQAFRSVQGNLSKTQRAAAALASAMGPLAAFASGGALLAIGKQAIESADRIQKMSKRLALSTEALSQYRHVAKLSGTDFEALAKAISRSQRVVADAEDGLATAKRAIADMGLSVAELKGLSPEAAFERMGAAMAAIEDPFTRASAAMNVFGRGGREIIPMFANGAGAVRAMREEADKLGLTLSQTDADKAAETADAMQRIEAALQGVTQNAALLAANPLIRALNTVAMAYTDEGTYMNQFLEKMEELKKTNPALRKEIVELTKAQRSLNYEWLVGAIRAREANEQFSIFLKEPDYNLPGEVGVPDYSHLVVAPPPAPIKNYEAAPLSVEDEAYGVIMMLDRQERGWADIRMAIAEATQAGVHYGEAIGPGLQDGYETATKFSDEMARTGVYAAQTFGDAIVDAAMRGGDALSSLHSILSNVLSSLLSFGINLGLNSLLPGAGAIRPNMYDSPIGPGLNGAPMGAGGVSVGTLSVTANSTLSADPMSTRRVAEQIYDELRRVGSSRGSGGRL